MFFRLAALALLYVSGVTSDNVGVGHRRLEFQNIAGYAPGSQVTDHAAIDLDQKALETNLKIGTDDAYVSAKNIYTMGGNSKSYAVLTLAAALTVGVEKNVVITGSNADADVITGKAKSDAAIGDTTISFQYSTADTFPHVTCKVGGLTEVLLDGCLKEAGQIDIGGTLIDYTYTQSSDNKAGRTLAGFSTSAEVKMYTCSNGCPHAEYKKFYDYYGQYDYADKWATAALDGSATDFSNGIADFSEYTFVGRTEAIKKGIVYMAVYMYVLREFEDAIGDCKAGCTDCNDDPVHAWDEGVAFYAGSLEGVAGDEGGKLVYRLAEKRCQNYMTCGEDGDKMDGTSSVNVALIKLFTTGKDLLLAGSCDNVRPTVDEITKLMSVPLVQGVLRYAYKVGVQNDGEKEKAEGATFAASVLPIVYACNKDDAGIIYDNMKVGAATTDFAAVKQAFENNYKCMGIKCEQVGALIDTSTGTYYTDTKVCENSVDEEDEEDSGEDGVAGLLLGLLLFCW